MAWCCARPATRHSETDVQDEALPAGFLTAVREARDQKRAKQTVTAAPAQPLSPAKAAAAPVADRDVDGGWGADTDALPRRAQAAPKQQDKQQQERRRDEPRGPLTTPQRPAKAAGAQPLTPAGAGARDADGKAAPSSATKSPNCARPTVASTVRAQETCRPAPSEATWHY